MPGTSRTGEPIASGTAPQAAGSASPLRGGALGGAWALSYTVSDGSMSRCEKCFPPEAEGARVVEMACCARCVAARAYSFGEFTCGTPCHTALGIWVVAERAGAPAGIRQLSTGVHHPPGACRPNSGRTLRRSGTSFASAHSPTFGPSRSLPRERGRVGRGCAGMSYPHSKYAQ